MFLSPPKSSRLKRPFASDDASELDASLLDAINRLSDALCRIRTGCECFPSQRKPGLMPGRPSHWRPLQVFPIEYECMHMIRKGQRQGVVKGNFAGQVTFIAD